MITLMRRSNVLTQLDFKVYNFISILKSVNHQVK